jgi:hypothetical protein
MANGLDRLPGHAYAPGMEPKFWESFVILGPDAAGGAPVVPMIVAVVILLALYLARSVGPGSRMRRGGGGPLRRGHAGPPLGRGPKPTQADILAKTLMDSNFARDLRVKRSVGRGPDAPEAVD